MGRMDGQKGFTLIELILVIVLVSVLTAGFGEAFLAVSRAYITADNRQAARKEGRWVLDRMSREMRLVQDNTSIAAADASTFSFVDVDGNTVTFSYNSGAGQINRTQSSPTPATNLLASDVSGFSLTYLDSADPGNVLSPPTAGLGTPTDIWRIRMNIQTSVNGESVALQTELHPRNL